MKTFWKAFLKTAEDAGITELEMMMQRSRNFSINVYEGEIEKYLVSEDGGYAFRGLYQGKMGYVYTEMLDPALIPELAKSLCENAEVIDSKDQELIFDKPNGPVFSDLRRQSQVDEEAKIQFAFDLEKSAKAYDSRIHKVSNSFFAEQESEYRLINSHGLDCQQNDCYYMAYSYLTAKDQEDQQTGFSFQITRDFADLKPSDIAREAAEEALAMLHPKRIPSGSYPVILDKKVMVDLLESFGSIFSANAVQKGLSRMKGKLGERVADVKVTMIDDPTGDYGFIHSPFDAEGVLTGKKEIISQGVLKTYLHNLKTAHKAGVVSTGNAYKSSYKGAMGIAPSNFYMMPGKSSVQDLIQAMGDGILITEVQGLHSGLNAVSGDFSLAASGLMIKNGASIHPIHQITIAGNWYQMIQDIEEIGSDLWFGIPNGGGHFGSPSIRLKAMSIAGE